MDTDEIYKRYARMVCCFLMSKGCNEDTAEELMQETFYQAVKNIGKFKGDSKISTWLCGIANNVLLKQLAKSKKEVSLTENIENGEFNENVGQLDWDSKEVLKCLHSLKEPIKEVVYLRLVGNLSFRDIGDIMGESENWARVNFYRGKEKIAREVKRNDR